MSDFLTNLVARNLEPATEIKPRLASLYEPPQPAGGILYGPTGDGITGPEIPFERGLQETTETLDDDPINLAERILTERLRGAQSLERNQQTRRKSSRLQRDDASHASTHELLIETSQPPTSFISPASAEQGTNWSTNQHPQTAPKQPSQEPSSQTVSPPIVPASQNEGPTRVAPQTSKLISPKTSNEQRTGPVIRTPEIDEKDAARQRVRATASEHSIKRDENDALDHRSAGHETRPAMTGPLTPRPPGQDVSDRSETNAPTGVFIRPQVTRKSEPEPPSHVAAHGETPQTINVTIGRIEVRATAANESRPRPQHKQTPTTSLDEYLRQRAQGVKR